MPDDDHLTPPDELSYENYDGQGKTPMQESNDSIGMLAGVMLVAGLLIAVVVALVWV